MYSEVIQDQSAAFLLASYNNNYNLLKNIANLEREVTFVCDCTDGMYNIRETEREHKRILGGQVRETLYPHVAKFSRTGTRHVRFCARRACRRRNSPTI